MSLTNKGQVDPSQFIDLLSTMHPLTQPCREEIAGIVKEEFYTKHQIICSPGQVVNRMWFIEKGAAMLYAYKDIDITPYHFWNEGDIMTDVSSFFRQEPAEGYIEILENSNLQSIDHPQIQSLSHKFPEIHLLNRSIAESYYAKAKKRAMDLLLLSPHERYEQLLSTSAFILQKTSMDYIAAYLGVSRKTLNRIRAKMNHR